MEYSGFKMIDWASSENSSSSFNNGLFVPFNTQNICYSTTHTVAAGMSTETETVK